MKTKISRYTINFVVNNNLVPFARSNLKNIDLLSTIFLTKQDLIDYLLKRGMISLPVSDLIVTYKYDNKVKQASLIFNDERDIAYNNQLVHKIISYLSDHNNVSNIDLNKIDNTFLKEQLYRLIIQPYPYNDFTRLNILMDLLNKKYKLKRDLALFLDKKIVAEGERLLTPPTEELDEMEREYILADYFLNLTVLEPFKSERKKQFIYTPPSDKAAYIDDYKLLAEYEELDRLNDLDDKKEGRKK